MRSLTTTLVSRTSRDCAVYFWRDSAGPAWPPRRPARPDRPAWPGASRSRSAAPWCDPRSARTPSAPRPGCRARAGSADARMLLDQLEAVHLRHADVGDQHVAVRTSRCASSAVGRRCRGGHLGARPLRARRAAAPARRPRRPRPARGRRADRRARAAALRRSVSGCSRSVRSASAARSSAAGAP